MKRIYIPITIVLTVAACYFADRFIIKPADYKVLPSSIEEDIMIEFSKGGLPFPAIRIGNNSSIHVITDENDKLVDVQVIKTDSNEKVSQYCTYSMLKRVE